MEAKLVEVPTTRTRIISNRSSRVTAMCMYSNIIIIISYKYCVFNNNSYHRANAPWHFLYTDITFTLKLAIVNTVPTSSTISANTEFLDTKNEIP